MSYLDQLAELRRQEKELQEKIKTVTKLALEEAMTLSEKAGKMKFQKGDYIVMLRQKPFIPKDVEVLKELENQLNTEKDRLLQLHIEKYADYEQQKKILAKRLEEIVQQQNSLLESETIKKLKEELELLKTQLTEYKIEIAIQFT